MKFRNAHAFIDMANWDRRPHFELFGRLDYPFIGLTARLDVSALLEACENSGQRFFTAFLYAAAEALNAQENFRYRLHDGRVVLCERIDPSFTVMDETQGLFYFAETPLTRDFAAFDRGVQKAKAFALEHRYLTNEFADLFYASCLPWMAFSDVIQPLGIGTGDSVPRLIWGRHETEGGRSLMPLSVTAHHGFVDGLHIARLFEGIGERMDCAPSWLPAA